METGNEASPFILEFWHIAVNCSLTTLPSVCAQHRLRPHLVVCPRVRDNDEPGLLVGGCDLIGESAGGEAAGNVGGAGVFCEF